MSSIRLSGGWGSYQGFDHLRRDIPERLSKMVIISLAIHLLLFSFLFFSRPFLAIHAANIPSYQVTLVAPDPAPVPSVPEAAQPTPPVVPPKIDPPKALPPKAAPAPPKAPPVAKGVPPVKEDPEGLREWWKKRQKIGTLQSAPAPRKPMPAPQPAPRLDLTKPAPQPEPVPAPAPIQKEASIAPPVNPVGKETPSIVVTGSASSDRALIKYPYYVKNVVNKINGAWIVPPATVEEEGSATVVLFYLHRSGKISRVEIEKSSGNPFFDQAALRAVYASDPLPPFPDDLTEDSLNIYFRFPMKKGS